jgi:hypothetical protein
MRGDLHHIGLPSLSARIRCPPVLDCIHSMASVSMLLPLNANLETMYFVARDELEGEAEGGSE